LCKMESTSNQKLVANSNIASSAAGPGRACNSIIVPDILIIDKPPP